MRVVADVAPPPGASNAERIRWEFEMLNRHNVSPLKEHLWTPETVGRFPDKTVHGPEEMGAVDGVDHFVLLDGARSTRRRAWPTTSSLRAADMAESPTHPNVVLIITDQERAP